MKHAFYSKSKRFCSLSCSRSFATHQREGKPTPKAPIAAKRVSLLVLVSMPFSLGLILSFSLFVYLKNFGNMEPMLYLLDKIYTSSFLFHSPYMLSLQGVYFFFKWISGKISIQERKFQESSKCTKSI